MQNDDKGFYSAVGLARRAGKVLIGTMACEQAIKKSRIKLIIVTKDTADNTLKKIKTGCERNNKELLVYGQSGMLGMALGKESIKVIGIVDKEFRKLILSKIQIERR